MTGASRPYKGRDCLKHCIFSSGGSMTMPCRILNHSGQPPLCGRAAVEAPCRQRAACFCFRANGEKPNLEPNPQSKNQFQHGHGQLTVQPQPPTGLGTDGDSPSTSMKSLGRVMFGVSQESRSLLPCYPFWVRVIGRSHELPDMKAETRQDVLTVLASSCSWRGF